VRKQGAIALAVRTPSSQAKVRRFYDDKEAWATDFLAALETRVDKLVSASGLWLAAVAALRDPPTSVP